jgi:hypothetical protein
MRYVILFLMHFLLLAIPAFAEPSDWSKLYNKSWKIIEYSMTWPERPEIGVVLIYSRGTTSRMNLDKLEMLFEKDGKVTGKNADGDAVSRTWKIEGDNKIWYDGDSKPSNVVKLTDSELVLQISQIVKSPETGKDELVITQNRYVSDGSALPVVLSYFNAKSIDDGKILLVWETTFELNSDHFDVEHSIDAKRFNSIGKVVSKNSNSVDQTYFFTHVKPTPSAANYYRLKLVDKDGAYTYSKIQSIKGIQGSSLEVFPNPTTDEVLFRGEDLIDAISVKIISLDGKEVYKGNHIINKKISLKSVVAGTYIVVIERKNRQIAVAKVVKK